MKSPTGRALRFTLPALVMVALMMSAPAQAACTNTVQGEIAAPTGSPNAPIFMTKQIASLTQVAYYIDSVNAGTTYNLYATGSKASLCAILLGCTEIPDFNIAFYTSTGASAGTHKNDGDHMGFTVPPLADHAIVYMSYGPDLGTEDGTVFAGFVYEDGC